MTQEAQAFWRNRKHQTEKCRNAGLFSLLSIELYHYELWGSFFIPVLL